MVRSRDGREAMATPQLWPAAHPPTDIGTDSRLRPVPDGDESVSCPGPGRRPPEGGPEKRPDLVLLLSIEETGRALGIRRSKTYELMAEGELEVVHIGRSVRIPVEAVEVFVARLRREAEGKRGSRKRQLDRRDHSAARPSGDGDG